MERWLVTDKCWPQGPDTDTAYYKGADENLKYLKERGATVADGVDWHCIFELGLPSPWQVGDFKVIIFCAPCARDDARAQVPRTADATYYPGLVFDSVCSSFPSSACVIMLSRESDEWRSAGSHGSVVCGKLRPLPFDFGPKACSRPDGKEGWLLWQRDQLKIVMKIGGHNFAHKAVASLASSGGLDLVHLLEDAWGQHTLFLGEGDCSLSANLGKRLSISEFSPLPLCTILGGAGLEMRAWPNRLGTWTLQDFLFHVQSEHEKKGVTHTLQTQYLMACHMWHQALRTRTCHITCGKFMKSAEP